MYSYKVKRTPDAKQKYKYNFNSKIYDLNFPNDRSSSFDSKIGATRADPNGLVTFPQKIKSNASFTLQKISNRDIDLPRTTKKKEKNHGYFRLPELRKPNNPEDLKSFHSFEQTVSKKKQPENYYQSKLYKAFKSKQNTYMMNLYRQHFFQTIQALKIGKAMKSTVLLKQIKVPKKNSNFKTIFLDLDECLVHCDESCTDYTVKLKFPIEGGGQIQAGVKIRPYCQQFLKELSSFAEIILFTASAQSYADVVLEYLDPHKIYFSYRLYRQHCNLQKGYYLKDLKVVNRKPENSVLVDNSAFSFMAFPYHGLPIVPFYNFSKDKQLLSLLEFLKKLVLEDDMRKMIKETFFWEKYLGGNKDARKVFLNQFSEEKQEREWKN